MNLPAELEALARAARLSDPVYVTRPTMPPLSEYEDCLRDLWESGWLTNMGAYHLRLESALLEYLDTPCISLFCNGTVALLIALQAFGVDHGEVITTPFTFPATAHVLRWNGVTPVFCDIDPETCTLDPKEVEARIGPNTTAILPVHVFGNPCDVDGIQRIADQHGIPVIYDAAHAFGVKYRGRPIGDYGDASMFSFHATKVFSTGEGGALVVRSHEMKRRIDYLKNFGIADEETVIGPGINGKMSELHAAYGLVTLGNVDKEIEDRRALLSKYQEALAGVPGIRFPLTSDDTEINASYAPILVDRHAYGLSRDRLHDVLRAANMHARKYFYPLCTKYACYRDLPSADPARCPVAEHVAEDILCLPLYGALDADVVRRICDVVVQAGQCPGESATA